MSQHLRRLLFRFWGALTLSPFVVPVVFCIAFLWQVARRPGQGIDFDVFYVAAKRALAGEDLYREIDGVMPFKYMPLAALLLTPILTMHDTLSYMVWDVFAVVVFAAALFSLGRQVPAGAPRFWANAIGIAATGLFVQHCLNLGQVDLFLFGALVLSERWALRRPFAAGALVGAAVLFKTPLLLMFVAMLWQKQWRRLFAAAATLLAGLIAPVLRYGVVGTIHQYQTWRQIVKATTPACICQRDNQSVWSLPCLPKTWIDFSIPVGTPLYNQIALGVAIGVALVVGGLLWRLHRRDLLDPLTVFAATCWAMFFFSPLGWWTNILFMLPTVYLLFAPVNVPSEPAPGSMPNWRVPAVIFALMPLIITIETVGSPEFYYFIELRPYSFTTLGLVVCALLWRLQSHPQRSLS